MQRSSVVLAALVIAGLLGVGAGDAQAQGYSVYEQSACMTGRGGAGVASPCADGSAVYFNPAGLSFDSTVVGLGAGLIGPRGDFTNTRTGLVSPLNDKWYPVPNIYFSTPFGKKVAFGIGVFAPYGLTTEWPVNSEGRFLGYKSVVQAVYAQPTVAFKLNENLSVAAGVDVTYLNVELQQRLDLSSVALAPGLTFAALGVAAGTDFGNVDLKGHAWHAGVHVGVLAKASDRVSVGARYMSGQRVKIDNGEIKTAQISAVRPNGSQYTLPISIPGVAPAGTPLDLLVRGQFGAGGKLASGQSATTSLPLPDQFVAGIAVQAAAPVKLFVDYEFTRWSMFDKLEIVGPANGLGTTGTVESYRNTNGVRVGTEVALAKAAVLRAGFDGHGAAAPAQTVTPNLPEAARQEYTLGIGLNLSPSVRFDVGYMYLHQQDRAGRTTTGGTTYPQPVPVSANNGTYAFKANIFNAMLALRF